MEGVYGLKMEDREKVLQALLSKERVLQLLYKKTFPEPVSSSDGQPSRPFSAAAAIAARPAIGAGKPSDRKAPFGAAPVPGKKGTRDWALDVDDMLAEFMGTPSGDLAQGS